VQSYRDLPLLINQWANVVRWEMRTRLFLRTTEFLWQEGHTAHATREEAIEETMRMLDVYADFAENWMAVPVIKGEKTAGERFPGAERTYCIEAMMQDRKALQAGTSHFLGQNFARASGIQFLGADGTQQHAWTTSWGVTTRLIGAILMTHSDDDGFVLPPKLAPHHVVIVPIFRSDEEKARVLDYCRRVAAELRAQRFNDAPVRVSVDERDERGGEKVWHWVRKGVPVRLEIGPRDMEKDSVFAGRRDRAPKDKQGVPRPEFVATIGATLQSIQDELLARAQAFRTEHTRRIDSRDEFYSFFASPRVAEDAPTPIHAGFALTHFSGDVELEKKIKDDLSVTVRCIPLERSEPGTCPFTGKPSAQRVVWAKAY
jgi:prolyl-tRNA synthetase